jgi:hypothetical protein
MGFRVPRPSAELLTGEDNYTTPPHGPSPSLTQVAVLSGYTQSSSSRVWTIVEGKASCWRCCAFGVGLGTVRKPVGSAGIVSGSVLLTVPWRILRRRETSVAHPPISQGRIFHYLNQGKYSFIVFALRFSRHSIEEFGQGARLRARGALRRSSAVKFCCAAAVVHCGGLGWWHRFIGPSTVRIRRSPPSYFESGPLRVIQTVPMRCCLIENWAIDFWSCGLQCIPLRGFGNLIWCVLSRSDVWDCVITLRHGKISKETLGIAGINLSSIIFKET